MSDVVAVRLLSPADAQRLTQRIKLVASGVRDGLFKLRNLVDDAKSTNAWQVLGFASWTAYLADTLGSEPMRLARQERQEIVAYLSGEGMSTRAIAPIVGASKDTVQRDRAGVSNETPAESEPVVDVQTGEVLDGQVEFMADRLHQAENNREVVKITGPSSVADPKPITGIDGKTYQRPVKPREEHRSPLTGDVDTAERALVKAALAIRDITNDDRFLKNKASVRDLLRPAADLIRNVLADVFDQEN